MLDLVTCRSERRIDGSLGGQMSQRPTRSRRIRRSATGLNGFSVAALSVVCMFAGCSGGQIVTPVSGWTAWQTCTAAVMHDYDLEWTASGPTSGHYVVTVRGGEVCRVESVAP